MKTNIWNVLCYSQEQAHNTILNTLDDMGMEMEWKYGSYIVANVDVCNPKPMLCIHIDTINTHNSKRLPEAEDFNIVEGIIMLDTDSNLSCLGADDRAGMYAMLEVLADEGIADKYCYGIFWDEEIGGVGSSQYIKDYKEYEEGVTCFIGLDRRGNNELALYGSDNQELISIFTDRGYIEATGSFTDASNLAYTKACVNLSVGYENEHTPKECLDLEGLTTCINTIKNKEVIELLSSKEYLIEGDYYEDFAYNEDMWDKLEAYENFIEMMGYVPKEVVEDYLYGGSIVNQWNEKY